MDYKNSIKEHCASIGIELTGFSRCRIFSELEPYFQNRIKNNLQNEFEEQDIDKRINPFFYMKEGKTIISIAFPYFHGADNNDEVYFSKYTLGNDYHIVLSKYLKNICTYIEGLGGRALYFADNNSLPESYLASLSGIGFIGKNNMLITEKYGSYVFLGEIITDLIIEEDKAIPVGCGNCSLCTKACPTGSVAANNPNICLSYITQKKDIEDKWFKFFQGRIFGCDTCQDVCPYNREPKNSPIDDFKPRGFMEHPDIMELVSLNNSTFKEKYKKTSAGWRGKGILQRNAIINLFYVNNEQKEHLKNIKLTSPRLQDIYNRLLNIFKL